MIGLLFLLAAGAVVVGLASRSSATFTSMAGAYRLVDVGEQLEHLRRLAMQLAGAFTSDGGVAVVTLTHSPISSSADIEAALARGKWDSLALGSLREPSTSSAVAHWLKTHDLAAYSYVVILAIDKSKWPYPTLYESVGGKP